MIHDSRFRFRLPRPLASLSLLTFLTSALTGCALDDSEGVPSGEGEVGQKSQELIGGRVAAPYHFRSTVGIGDECTAAKVGPRLFLTAGHCVSDVSELISDGIPTEDPSHDGVKDTYSPGESLDIRYGILPEDTDEHYDVTIAKVSIHPSWLGCTGCSTPISTAADIAVIEVEEETDNIPEARVELGPVAAGTQVVKVGMGCTESAHNPNTTLQEYKSADAWTLPKDALLLGTPEVREEADAPRIASSYLITAGRAQGEQYASLCPGDSGGPLYLPRNDDPRIVGVNAGYQFNGSGVSWNDWHTKTAFESRFTVGKWLYDLNVNTVGGGDYEGDGGITMERWNNVSGWSVSQIPTWRAADSQQVIEDFEIYPNSQDNGNNYGVRVRGTLTAPATGSYVFWIAGDDQVSLSLGTNESPSSSRRIAYHTGYTASQEWKKYDTQKSGGIYLIRGRRYYIEALMKEGQGGDNLAVGWSLPGDNSSWPTQIIPAHQLSPITPDDECTCPKGCNAVKSVSTHFQLSGFDDNCYFFDDLGAAVYSDSMDEVNLNGQDITDDLWVIDSSYPARRDGGYYLYLKSDNHMGFAMAID